MKNAYLLTKIDDALDQLAEAKWLSRRVIGKVAMNPDSREKTAFYTPQGL